MLKGERALRETALGACDRVWYRADGLQSAGRVPRQHDGRLCIFLLRWRPAAVTIVCGICEMQHLAVCPTADMQRWPYAASRLWAPPFSDAICRPRGCVLAEALINGFGGYSVIMVELVHVTCCGCDCGFHSTGRPAPWSAQPLVNACLKMAGQHCSHCILT